MGGVASVGFGTTFPRIPGADRGPAPAGVQEPDSSVAVPGGRLDGGRTGRLGCGGERSGGNDPAGVWAWRWPWRWTPSRCPSAPPSPWETVTRRRPSGCLPLRPVPVPDAAGGLLGRSTIVQWIREGDHWVAFGLLAVVGSRMIRRLAWTGAGRHSAGPDPRAVAAGAVGGHQHRCPGRGPVPGADRGLHLVPAAVIGLVAAGFTLLGLRLGTSPRIGHSDTGWRSLRRADPLGDRHPHPGGAPGPGLIGEDPARPRSGGRRNRWPRPPGPWIRRPSGSRFQRPVPAS
jgi:hypothetical protein